MIIYKKDSKGNIRYLDIEADGSKIVQRSGILDTENEVEHVKVAKPKNIGKSNETTAEQQAIQEVISTITSKLQEGYFQSIKEAENEVVIFPMLAKSYKDEKNKIDWNNCFVQPKLDGQRCLAHINNGVVKLISRDGRLIENVDHILNSLVTVNENVILDGELYAHGLSFQDNMKLIKKYRKGETENIKYHVYDIVSEDPFKNRSEKVKEVVGDISTMDILILETSKINNEETLNIHHQSNLASGYEGSIIRWGNEPYKMNGRSSNLLKYKDFQDIDAEIIDIVPAEQRPEWGVPVLKYTNQKVSGVNIYTFRAGLKYSHEDRKEFLTNKEKYIGKIANIRFFEYTDDGLPRFPIMFGIRGDCQNTKK